MKRLASAALRSHCSLVPKMSIGDLISFLRNSQFKHRYSCKKQDNYWSVSNSFSNMEQINPPSCKMSTCLMSLYKEVSDREIYKSPPRQANIQRNENHIFTKTIDPNKGEESCCTQHQNITSPPRKENQTVQNNSCKEPVPVLEL